MRLVATRKSEQNDAVIDPWTMVHIGTGLAMGLMGFRAWPAFALAAGYEVLEQPFERSGFGQHTFKTSGPENVANSVMDVVVFMGAWYLGAAWNRT